MVNVQKVLLTKLIWLREQIYIDQEREPQDAQLMMKKDYFKSVEAQFGLEERLLRMQLLFLACGTSEGQLVKVLSKSEKAADRKKYRGVTSNSKGQHQIRQTINRKQMCLATIDDHEMAAVLQSIWSI